MSNLRTTPSSRALRSADSHCDRLDTAGYYVAIIVGTVIFALFTIFHKQIVNWLQPAANWMHRCVSVPVLGSTRLWRPESASGALFQSTLPSHCVLPAGYSLSSR